MAALAVALAAGAQSGADHRFWRSAAQGQTTNSVGIAADNGPQIQPREFHEFHDFIANTFRTQPPAQIPAQDVDRLGGVPDSTWYTNRHASRRMSIAELVRGPGDRNAPSLDGPWQVLSAKQEGVTPGFQIRDARGRKYMLKFDPPAYPELASGTEVIATKFFYALGYNVPENYVVTFDRRRLVAATHEGKGKQKHKPIREADIDTALVFVPKNSRGEYRALASLILEGEPLGPFLFQGVRPDDPADTIPHENRRELRGLYVFCAWLNHTDAKAGNTLDMLVDENGRRFVKHYLIDFGATLGSASIEPKSPRQGHEYLIDFKPSLAHALSLGLYAPKWARVRTPELRGVGNFEPDAFDPAKWKSNYPNPAFDHRLPDDEFWAARKVMAFTDDEIRAIVATGRYSDPRAAAWIANTLIARRDKIARAFGEAVLPLDRFRVRGNRLEFDDLGRPALASAFAIEWLLYDGRTGQVTPLARAASLDVPDACDSGDYCAARIAAPNSGKAVVVYVAKRGGEFDIVGVDREW